MVDDLGDDDIEDELDDLDLDLNEDDEVKINNVSITVLIFLLTF